MRLNGRAVTSGQLLWTARAEQFALATPNGSRWADLLTDKTRSHIPAINETVCGLSGCRARRSRLAYAVYARSRQP